MELGAHGVMWMEVRVPLGAECGEGGPRPTGCWGRVGGPVKCWGQASVEGLDRGRVGDRSPMGCQGKKGLCPCPTCDTVGPQVNVGEGSHPSRVKVHGPGVEKTGLKANEPTYFTVDCSEAGQGGCHGGGHPGNSSVA